MFNLEQAKKKVEEGHSVTNISWGACKIIRKATLADEDIINYPHEGVIVETCEDRICDCKTIIYQPTPEDLTSETFVIAA